MMAKFKREALARAERAFNARTDEALDDLIVRRNRLAAIARSDAAVTRRALEEASRHTEAVQAPTQTFMMQMMSRVREAEDRAIEEAS